MRAAHLVLVALAAVVSVVAVRAWQGAGRTAYAELEDRGQGLVQVLAGALSESQERGREAEQREQRRLLSVARRIATDLERPLGPTVERLERLALEEDLGRAFLVDAQGQRVVRVARGLVKMPDEGDEGAHEPLGSEQEWQSALASMAPLLDGSRQHVEEGVRPNVFGTTHRLAVGVRLQDGGALLVASNARDLADLKRGAALARVLADVCRLPDVSAARLTRADEVVAAAQAPAPGRPAGDAPRTFVATLAAEPGAPLTLTLELSSARVEALARTERRGILLWGVLGVGAALLGAWALWRLERAARRQRAHAEAARREQQRLSEVGVLTGLFVHELSNPLNALALQLGALERSVGGAGAESFEKLKRTLGRARTSLESFLHVAAPLEPRVGEGYDAAHLRRTLAELSEEGSGAALSLEVEAGAEALRIPARVPVLDQALRNVLRNAVQASPAGAAVRVSWARSGAGGARVVVRDAGAGFPQALLEAGPTLGVSGRREGHGLGLYLARRIVEGLGGSLLLANPVGGGAEVALLLPGAGATS